MKMASMADAQQRLPELVRQAQDEMIGITDDEGRIVGYLSGVTDDCIDDLLVRTPGFREMIARSIASLEKEPPISAEELLAEAQAELAREHRSTKRLKGDRAR
jgi:hypothetical protein